MKNKDKLYRMVNRILDDIDKLVSSGDLGHKQCSRVKAIVTNQMQRFNYDIEHLQTEREKCNKRIDEIFNYVVPEELQNLDIDLEQYLIENRKKN